MVTIWKTSQLNFKTSSGNVAIRYLQTVISFPPRNIRGSLQWIFLARVLRGPRTIDEDLFRFFEVSDGWDQIRVADYPLCTEKFLETYRARPICLD